MYLNSMEKVVQLHTDDDYGLLFYYLADSSVGFQSYTPTDLYINVKRHLEDAKRLCHFLWFTASSTSTVCLDG